MLPVTPSAVNWSTQELTAFLASVSSAADERTATRLAVERAAEALDAEVAALLRRGSTDDVTLRHGVTGPRLVQKPFESETLLSPVREALDARSSSGV